MAALVTAMTWSIAVILFKRSGETVHPLALNLFKNLLGAVLILFTMIAIGQPIVIDKPFSLYVIMVAAGALGIGISDTLFFMSLNRLGAGLSAIVDCMYSPSIIFFSIILLGESLNAQQVIGVLLIISAVLTATNPAATQGIERKQLILGVIFGVSAMVTMAISIVYIKPMLDTVSVLWAMEFRLLGGVLMLMVLFPLHPNGKKAWASFKDVRGWKFMVPGAFFGTYLALILWLLGMKYTQASTASILNQTSNIFIFILAALILKEPLNLPRIIGILLGVSGVVLVFLAKP